MIKNLPFSKLYAASLICDFYKDFLKIILMQQTFYQSSC